MTSKSPQQSDKCRSANWYCESARQAFRSILLSKSDETRKILLPGYIGITDREGSGVFDPITSTNTAYDFYRVDRSLGMNKSEVALQITSGNYFAILVIHYFGFCQTDMFWLRDICEQNDIIIIEDCAHTMGANLQGTELGGFGDYSIYALHKILRAKNGGLLKMVRDGYRFTPQGLNLPETETLDAVLTTDMVCVVKTRRRNYLHWLAATKELTEVQPIYDQLPEGISPHNFPVLVSDGMKERLYFKLIDSGVPVVALYYRMIPQLPTNGFEDAHYVSQNILNLPVHQDIALQDIKNMAKALKNAISELWPIP